MSTLSDLDRQARKLILELRQGIAQLESSPSSSSSSPPPPGGPLSPQSAAAAADAGALREKLRALIEVSREMETLLRTLVSREPPSRRMLWKKKVETVAEEVDALRMGMDIHFKRCDEARRGNAPRAAAAAARGRGARI